MILVTGASQGIGYACVRALLDRTRARVVMTGRSAEKLASARGGVPAQQQERLETRVSDQDDRGAVEALAAWLVSSDEPIDGAILTVGTNPMYALGPQRIHSLSAATIDDTIRTNCTHTMLLTAALLDRFRRQRAGVLVWIGSQAPQAGLPGAGLYCGTKSFLSGIAHAAHNEYAGRGVRVHLLHPGVVRTPRTEAVADAFAVRHGLKVADAAEVGSRIVDVFLAGDPLTMEMNLC